MTHASLFSGIGGFDLAAEWAGWTNAFNCEIDPFCRTILKYHFPDAKRRIPDWNGFPTQPPVCGGDDGFPGELAGIAFPLWRREAVKACGNAIVPQVALRIFETINEYEKI